MESCCSSPGNDEVFTSGTAWRTARRYRWLGTVVHERRLLVPVLAAGVKDATVLEIGGGVGQLQLELLDAGAQRAINLELSPHYEQEARRLAGGRGHLAAVTRLLGDAAHPPDGLPQDVDVALLHRVVCCTDDWQSMLDTALAGRPRVLGLTFPRKGLVPNAVAALGNGLLYLLRDDFRVRHHDPDQMLSHLQAAGMSVADDRSGVFWRSVVLTR